MLAEEMEASSSQCNGFGKALETYPEPSRKQQPMHDYATELGGSAHRALAVSPCRPCLKPRKAVKEAPLGRSSSYLGKADRGRSASPASVASTASSIPSFTASVNSLPSTPSHCSIEYMDSLGSRHGSPVPAVPKMAGQLDGHGPLHTGDASTWSGMGGIAVAAEVEPDVSALLVLKKRLTDRLYGAQPGPRRVDKGANVTELLSLRLRLANALSEGNCNGGAAKSMRANVTEILPLRVRLTEALREGNCGSGVAMKVASSVDDALARSASAVVPSMASPRFVAVVCDGLAYLLPSAASNMHMADAGRFE